MAGILKGNMKALRKRYPYVGVLLEESLSENETDVCNIMDGALYFEKNNSNYRITSCNQEKEAAFLLRNIDFERENLILVFGSANVVLLRELVEKTCDGTRIAVFEPNMTVFRYVIKNNSLTDIIDSDKLVFFPGKIENFRRYMQIIFTSWINLVLNLEVISLPSYYLYGEFRNQCMDTITAAFRGQLANMGNSLEDTMIGIDNQYVNAEYCMKSNSINEIRGKYEGYPAIIVASGPSLDKNVDRLKEAQGKALIITCDASYRTCLANDVKPDMIASIERGIETYQYYYERQEFDKDLVLIGPSVLRPEIYEKVPGKKIIMAKSGIGNEGWWKNLFDSVEFVDMGHSCATVAFGVAQAAGCSPIILIGQDLAYTDDKIHGDLAHTEFEGDNKRKSIEDDIWTKDIYGEPIRTSETYNVFRYYFEDKVTSDGVDIVDATEGGAYISGSKVMTLEEAINIFCTKEIPFALNNLLEERPIDAHYMEEKYREIKKAVDVYIEELEEIQAKCREFHKGIIHYKDYDFESATEEDLIGVLEILTENNQLLPYLYNEHTNMLGYYMQNIKQTIINVKNLGNKITSDTVRRNWVLQVNLIEMIDLASSVVINEYLKIREYMEEKEKEMAQAM